MNKIIFSLLDKKEVSVKDNVFFLIIYFFSLNSLVWF